jgi:hypothetical protein
MGGLSLGRVEPRLVVVRPVFTAAAYSEYPVYSFYAFFKKFSNVSENSIVRTDLHLLNTSVREDDWGKSHNLRTFLSWQKAGLLKDPPIITDIDVNDGKLFDTDGNRRYDVAILGFTEYVSQQEYSNYKHFVETGGRLILLDACNFLAEVKYNHSTNTVSLVKGKGWEFNGTAARKGVYHRWHRENTNWVGSNFGLFHLDGYEIYGAIPTTTHPLGRFLRTTIGSRVFTSYRPHEENIVTNSSVKVIASWDIISKLKIPGMTVAMYEHYYQKGSVIHTGISGSDIIATEPHMQLFLHQAIQQPPNPDYALFSLRLELSNNVLFKYTHSLQHSTPPFLIGVCILRCGR